MPQEGSGLLEALREPPPSALLGELRRPPPPSLLERAGALPGIIGRGVGRTFIRGGEALGQIASQVAASTASSAGVDEPLQSIAERPPGFARNPLAGPIHEAAGLAQRGLEAVNPIPEAVLNEPPGLARTVFTEIPEAIAQTGALAATGMIGGPLALFGGSALAQGGAAYAEAIDKGADPEMAFGAMALNLPIGALDALEPAAVGRILRIGKVFAGIDKASGGAIKNFLKTGVWEAGTEGVQQALENAVAAHGAAFDEDRPITQDVLKSMGIGGVVGGGASVLAGVAESKAPSQTDLLSVLNEPPPSTGAQDRARSTQDLLGQEDTPPPTESLAQPGAAEAVQTALPEAQPQPGTSSIPPVLDPRTGETAAALPITDQAPPSDTKPLETGRSELDVGGAAVPASTEAPQMASEREPPQGPPTYTPAPGEENAPSERLIDNWLGDRHVSQTEAEIEARKKENALRQIAPDRENFDALNRAMFVYIDAQNDPSMSEYASEWTPEQKATYELSQNLPPAVRALADQINAETKAQGERLSDAGLIKNQVENYLPRIYEPTKRAAEAMPGEAKAKFTLSSPRLKGRVFKSIGEAWAEGYELRVKGAIEAQRVAQQQTDQVLFDRALVDEGMRSRVFSGTQEDGYLPVEHPNFRPWRILATAPEGASGPAQTFGFGTVSDEQGNILQRQQVYAPVDLARRLNKILGTSKLRDVTGVNAVTRLTSAVKQSILFTSLFHHQSVLRSYIFGAPLSDMNPVRAYRDGHASMEAFGPQLRQLVHRGLTLGYQQEWDDLRASRATKFEEMLSRIPGIKQALPKIEALREWNENYLFKNLIPSMKAQAALLAYRDQLSKHREALANGTLTEQQLAENVARYVNDNFGGLNLQRMGRDPTVQHAMRLLLLAPDWTESNLRAIAEARKKGAGGELYRKLWLNTVLRGGIATVIFNALMAGFDKDPNDPASKNFWTRYQEAWKEGNLRWLDADVTPIYRALGGTSSDRKYFSILGHFKDPLRLAVNPVRFFKAKGSVISKIALEALTGRDPLDRPYTSMAELTGLDERGDYKTGSRKGEPKGGKLAGEFSSYLSAEKGGALTPEQMPSFALSQIENAMPIQVQAGADLLSGQIDWFDAITHSLGLMTSTSPPRTPERLIERDRSQAELSGDKRGEQLARYYLNDREDIPGARKLASLRDAAKTPQAKAQLEARLNSVLRAYVAKRDKQANTEEGRSSR